MTLYEKSINKDLKIKKRKQKSKEKSPRKVLKKKNSWISPKQTIIPGPPLSKRHSAINLLKLFDETNMPKAVQINNEANKKPLETIQKVKTKKINDEYLQSK